MTRHLFTIVLAFGMAAEMSSAPPKPSNHPGHQMLQGACVDLTSFELDPASTSLARKWRRDGGGGLLVYR